MLLCCVFLQCNAAVRAFVAIFPSWFLTSLYPYLGLKHALATVNDYNPLMKDFPLEELLSATELSRIRSALVSIFSHMRKIRSTRYPVQRALRLVEAISRDLSSQFLKVGYVFEDLGSKFHVMVRADMLKAIVNFIWGSMWT